VWTVEQNFRTVEQNCGAGVGEFVWVGGFWSRTSELWSKTVELVWESLCGWVGFGSRGKNVV
jgi:hypothetical protein